MFSKRNVSNKLRLAILLVLSAGIILSFATGALAQVETWSSGPLLKFQVKSTELITDTEPWTFKKTTKKVTGTLELYTEVDGPPTRNGEGYYMKFEGTDQNGKFVAMGITQLAMIGTEVNATSNKFLAVGVGEFFDPNSPVDPWGIVYVDLSGSVKKSATKPTNVSMVIKMGGGIDEDVIISANINAQLTKLLGP